MDCVYYTQSCFSVTEYDGLPIWNAKRCVISVFNRVLLNSSIRSSFPQIGFQLMNTPMAEVIGIPRRCRGLFFFFFPSSAAVFLRRFIVAALLLGFVFCSISLPFSSTFRDFVFSTDSVSPQKEEYRLERVLKEASTEDKTVIITTLNEAWAAPNSVFDLFLESFRIGNNTRSLLNNLVVVAMDAKAYKRCLLVHNHCFALVTGGTDFSEEADFMTPDYLKMMWRRIDFLRSILEMGYNFVFTDTDIMWFRDPFHEFHSDADFQIACDHFSGKPFDLQNSPNGGFVYVRSTNKSVAFYKYWHSSRLKFPGKHDQDVLNFIKSDRFISEIGLRMRFLDTSYFGGLCEPSKDFNLVCTMHVNCCVGMDRKVNDLKIMLQDWTDYMSLSSAPNRTSAHTWRVPKNCR
ncbi:hypothetical protein V2J09_009899 [Rumex salicifolius]